MQHITLIRPPAAVVATEMSLFAVPHIGLAYIAGTLTENGYICSVIDAIGEAFDQKNNELAGDTFVSYGLSIPQIIDKVDPKTDLIGVTCSFTKEWLHNKLLLNTIKQNFPDIPIVCGGEHITADPIFSMIDCQAIDYCVLGEGEETVIDLIHCLENKSDLKKVHGLAYRNNHNIIQNERRPRIKNIDEIPLPKWELFPIDNYLDNKKGFGAYRGRSMPILATRGCPYRCSFCSSLNMWTTRWIARKPEKVVEEIEKYVKEYKATNFDFYDLTVIIRKDWIVEFANLLISKKLNITWQIPSGTRSEAIDLEVCQLLYKSGCKNISYSPESASISVLKRINKRMNLKNLTKSIKYALDSGLNIKVNLIFGFPRETHKEIWQNIKYILRLSFLGVHDLAIWFFAPYPGSELFNELRESGEIKEYNETYLDSITYGRMVQLTSWNENMSVRWLNFYRLGGYLLFYGASYFFHPVRIGKTIVNLIRGNHESRIETVLAEYFTRVS